MTRTISLLALGPSGLVHSDGGPRDTIWELLEDALVRQHPEVGWECHPELLLVSEGMAARALRAVEKHKPDAVALLLPPPAFADDYVVYRIRRLLPALYGFSLRLSKGLKALAGGGSEGSPGVRGLLFRIPQRIVRFLIGADPSIDVTSATRCASETIEALVRTEALTTAVRVGPAVPAHRHRLAEHHRRMRQFNAPVTALCDRRRVPWYDLDAALDAAGRRTGFVPDGVHQDLPTRSFDMELMASTLAAAVLG